MDKDRKTKEAEKKQNQEQEKKHQEEKIDEAVEETFPASDPPSTSSPKKEE